MEADLSSPALHQGDDGGKDEEIAVESSPREKRLFYEAFPKTLTRLEYGSLGAYGRLRGQHHAGSIDPHPYLGLYDEPLPFFGCGIGWFLFLLGFGIPLAWLYASYLYFSAYQENDPRERAGLAACAVAAMVATTAGIFTGIVLFLEGF